MSRPSSPSVVRLSIDFSTNGAWSKTTVSSAPEAAFRASSRSRISCEISTALPPGAATTSIPRLSLPSVRVNPVGSASCCVTVATSPSRTLAPDAPVTHSVRRSSTDPMGVPTCTVRVWSSWVSPPAGTAMPLA
jgi:hypothetical protein